MNNLVFFAAYVAAVLGQFSDARTTEVGLQKGLAEANPIGAFLIKRLGTSGSYAVKCGALPVLVMPLLAIGHTTAALALELIFAGTGFAAGILNYLKLRKSGVTINQVF